MNLLTTIPAIAMRTVDEPLTHIHASDPRTVIQDEFRLLPQVENVSIDREDDTVFVWIAVNNPAKWLRYEIYAKQMNLIEAFPEVSFDFSLISGTFQTTKGER